jgi:hypothetical protein
MTEQEISTNLQLIERMLRDETVEVTLLRGTRQIDKGDPFEHHTPTSGKTVIIRTGGGARNEEKISFEDYQRQGA